MLWTLQYLLWIISNIKFPCVLRISNKCSIHINMFKENNLYSFKLLKYLKICIYNKATKLYKHSVVVISAR